MAAPRFSNPFQPLNLSREAEAQLEELAALFVVKAVANYEHYLFRDHREIDPQQWKFLKKHEDVRVYRQRSGSTMRSREGSHASGEADPSSSESTSSISDNDNNESFSMLDADAEPEPPLAKPPSLPVMLTVGTLPGDLNDTMYGAVNPSLDMMRIQTSYVESVDIVNAAMLAVLKEPTEQDPFGSLCVRWTIKGQPLHIRTIVKNRDMVYLESTGLTRLPTTGERVGFHLLHSVNFSQTPKLDDSLRGNVSICALYRQHQENVVDVYVRGFLDPTGRIMRALVVKSAAVVMLAVGRNIVCAHLKKLAYALRRRHNPVLQNSTFSDRLRLRDAHKRLSVARGAHVESKECTICGKGLSSLAPLTFGMRSNSAQCRLCLQNVCLSCRVKKKLSSITPEDGRLHRQNIPFCLLCITAVTQANALDIARDEVAQNDASLGYGRHSAFCSSPDSGQRFVRRGERQSPRRPGRGARG